jgi:hypothetical protein
MRSLLNIPIYRQNENMALNRMMQNFDKLSAHEIIEPTKSISKKQINSQNISLKNELSVKVFFFFFFSFFLFFFFN